MTLRKPIKLSVALAKMQDLCARSEQCSYEILLKLRALGVEEPAAVKILTLLKRDRYIDDRRYAEAFVRDKVLFNRWGRTKIRIAMKQKRLDDDLIADSLDSIDDSEYRDALVEVMASKARTLSEVESYESRKKILRYAVSRGFEIAVVLDYLKRSSLWSSGRS